MADPAPGAASAPATAAAAPAPSFIATHLRGFARASSAYCQLARPERQQQLLDMVRSASHSLLARGAGCAYGDEIGRAHV